MNDMAEQWIRKLTKMGYLRYSTHAKDRMIERQIDDNKIVECIMRGKIIEIQTQFDDIHVLFQESTDKDPEIYVVVAASYPYPVVVTVCKTMDEIWEAFNGILKRRRENK